MSTLTCLGVTPAAHEREVTSCSPIQWRSSRSDRRSQYTSQKFLDHLNAYGVRPWGVLKNERIYRIVSTMKDKAINDFHSVLDTAQLTRSSKNFWT